MATFKSLVAAAALLAVSLAGPDDRPFDGANVELPDPETWEMERVGREPVNGVAATKYRVATDGGEATRMRGYLWISDDGIPVRTDMVTGGDRIQMELRDLVVGSQPAELFEPPAARRRATQRHPVRIGSPDAEPDHRRGAGRAAGRNTAPTLADVSVATSRGTSSRGRCHGRLRANWKLQIRRTNAHGTRSFNLRRRRSARRP
jgi:hypothetical protein